MEMEINYRSSPVENQVKNDALTAEAKKLTSWTELLTHGAGMVVHLLLLKGSMNGHNCFK